MQQEKKPPVYELPPLRRPARRQAKKLIACVVGARPEAIKMAPVIKSLKSRHDYYDVQVILTGQHPQAEDILASDFDIQADENLKVIRSGQSLDQLMGRTMFGADAFHREAEKANKTPDMLLVQGDTTSAFSAAMSAFHRKIPVGHVEAGLRSHNGLDPFPEEMNRRLIGTLADVHFAPTRVAQGNLLKEGVAADRIALTGNTVVDALNRMITINGHKARSLPEGVPDDGHRLLVATMHRRESWGKEIGAICRALRQLVDRFEDTRLVVPLHPNPTVAKLVTQTLGAHDRIHPIPALPYGEFIRLVAQSHLLLTDSGGIQEEAPTLRIPALVMRDTSERTEAIESRHVKLVGRNPNAILTIASTLLGDRAAYDAMRSGANPFGDGQAAARITLAMQRYFEGEATLLGEEETFEAGRNRLTANDPEFAAERYRQDPALGAEYGRGSPEVQVDAIKRYLAEYHRNEAA